DRPNETLNLCPDNGALSDWARWLTRFYDERSRRNAIGSKYKIGMPDEIAGLCHDLGEFEKDMQELQLQWGPNLLRTPEIIWDEVTAFTPSRFLLQSLSTKTTSLSPRAIKSSSSSGSPLCTISDAASDGKLMGILSIWPSR